MTLGGLALAVGILVDDATVTIENINFHLEEGAGRGAGDSRGRTQIALPALVSTLSICIVFVPMFLLAGHCEVPVHSAGRSGGVCHAGLVLLSRTLIPDAGEVSGCRSTRTSSTARAPRNFLSRFQHGFEQGFEQDARRLS
jgi:multidrug efflux pump subunit AcrB